jgi:hypothetical protein
MTYNFTKKTDVIGTKMYYMESNHIHFLCIYYGSGMVEIHDMTGQSDDCGVYYGHLQEIINANGWVEA